MIFEASSSCQESYEYFLDCKKAYEEWRDGYMPYIDDKKEFEDELERRMWAMDYAEDCYLMAKMEYDTLAEENRDAIFGTTKKTPRFEKQTLTDLYEQMTEAKSDYDELSQCGSSFPGSNKALSDELRRRREAWMDAYDAFKEAFDAHESASYRRKLDEKYSG